MRRLLGALGLRGQWLCMWLYLLPGENKPYSPAGHHGQFDLVAEGVGARHKGSDWRSDIVALMAVATGCFVIGETSADDTEIFFNSETPPPNILFVVDVSGSMDWTDVSPLPVIPGNVLWLDGADRSSILDAEGVPADNYQRFSASIATWLDKSGNGNHLTGTSATLDNINGKTTVRFTNDIMTGPDLFSGSMREATVFAVIQENVSSRNFLLNFNGNSTDSHDRLSFHTPWFNRNWYWDAGKTPVNRNSIARATAPGEVTQMTAYKSVAENRNGFSLNNGSFSVVKGGATAAVSTGGMYFGLGATDHEIAELIVYDRMLSDDEKKTVEQHLDKKWRTRLERLKVSLSTLFGANGSFNAGLITYSSYVKGQFSLRDEIQPLAESRDSLLGHIDELYAHGGTPTQSAMFEAMRYYRGEPPIAMGGIANATRPSLVDCQTNHIVLLTDGEPYGGASWPTIGSYIGSNCAKDQGSNTARGNCGIELARYMYENDHNSEVRGTNGITTHTIGLSLDMQWLRDMASVGGGQYHSVVTSDQLLKAFESILAVAIDQSTTFVAPAVTVDQFSRLAHREDTYLALFQPSSFMRWPGNLKRYSFSGSPPAIRDQNNKRVMNPDTGDFSEKSHSFWSETADGGAIGRGGAASKLEVDLRTVATYTGSGSTELNDYRNKVHENNAQELASWFDIAGDELTNLLAWARGVDVDDDDKDGSRTDTRHQMGDPLHSSPAILTYGGTAAEPDSVVFIGTNEGYLHAISSKDGAELYAFIPPELLGNLNTFYENSTGIVRPNGLDGSLELWIDDLNHNGIVDASTEKAYLYVGMRRGGSNYYALDVTEKTNPRYQWTIKGGVGNSDFQELGQSWSKPTKSKIRIADTTRDVLIFGGGYDPAQDHSTIRSSDTVGNTVFIVDAVDGSLIWKTAMDSDSDYSRMTYSIPSDPRLIDLNGDGFVDQMYIGDLGGQVWRFDFNSNASTPAKLVSGGLIADLATDNPNDNRRFFYPPDVALVSLDGAQFLSLAIGSGNRAHPLGRSVENRFYMIRQDDITSPPQGYGVVDVAATASRPATYRPITEDDLYDATDNDIDSSNGAVALAAKDALKDNHGWLLRLDGNGEKVLGSSVTIDHNIVFSTYLPEDSENSSDDCKPAAGGNRGYMVSLYDATPVNGPFPTDRYVDVNLFGIATTSVLFNTGAVESDEGTSVNAIIGLETNDLPKINLLKRIYWSEYPDF